MKPRSPHETPKLPAVTLTSREHFLALLFLRRCVTWCARKREFDRPKRAARLWYSIRNVAVSPC